MISKYKLEKVTKKLFLYFSNQTFQNINTFKITRSLNPNSMNYIRKTQINKQNSHKSCRSKQHYAPYQIQTSIVRWDQFRGFSSSRTPIYIPKHIFQFNSISLTQVHSNRRSWRFNGDIDGGQIGGRCPLCTFKGLSCPLGFSMNISVESSCCFVNCERTISKLSELSLGLIWVILYGVYVFALKAKKM